MNNNYKKTHEQLVQVIMAFANNLKWYAVLSLIFGVLTVIGVLNGYGNESQWFCLIGVIVIFAGTLHGMYNCIKKFISILNQ